MPFSKLNLDTSRNKINFNFCSNGIFKKKLPREIFEPVKFVVSPRNPPLIFHEDNKTNFFLNFFGVKEKERLSGNIVFDEMGNFFSDKEIKENDRLILKSIVPMSNTKTVTQGEKGNALAKFKKDDLRPFFPIPDTDGNFLTNGFFFATEGIEKDSLIFNINTFSDEIKPIDNFFAVFNSILIDQNKILPFVFTQN